MQLHSLAPVLSGVSGTQPTPHQRTRAPSRVSFVRVCTDDLEAAEASADAIRKAGVPLVEVTLGDSFSRGFRLAHHPSLNGTELLNRLEGIVREAMQPVDHGQRLSINVYGLDHGAPADTVEIDLPLRAARDGRLLRDLLADLGSYEIHLAGAAQPNEAAAQLTRALAASGVRAEVRATRGHAPGAPRIVVGAAPLEVGAHLAQIVLKGTGVRLRVRRDFSGHSDYIWIVLPQGTPMAPMQPVAPASVAARPEARPFLELTDGALRVGARVLERRPTPHPLAPDLGRFAHTCVDTPTAEILEHLATSVHLREPVLLEGPTAAGKTASVLFLAALLRQPVVRINLSGQTDTGELIGRYAPQEGGWRWQDGLLPRAMREGWWVLLDELNLAEPSVAERLNPVLEREPTLVLTEGDGRRYGPGGEPVARRFHVFATLNPPEGAYRGRHALSPALRDRFVAQRRCPPPGEAEHLALLQQLVFDRPPSVRVRGVEWRGFRLAAPTPHAALGEVPGIADLLVVLARFHASVDAASRAQDDRQRLGAGRPEGLTVSRRTLLALLDFLVAHQAGDAPWPQVVAAAVDRYYRARAASAEDTVAMDALARAAGLPPLTEDAAGLAG